MPSHSNVLSFVNAPTTRRLKDGGNEGELITQVMAKEMGGLDLRVDWGARIVKDLSSYNNVSAESLKARIEKTLGCSLSHVSMAEGNRNASSFDHAVLPFKPKRV